MTTGDKIRQARKTRGLTLEQVAHRCGRHKQQLAAWESDLNDIRLGNLEAVARALGMSVVELLSIR